jgi:hypothetical protein
VVGAVQEEMVKTVAGVKGEQEEMVQRHQYLEPLQRMLGVGDVVQPFKVLLVG